MVCGVQYLKCVISTEAEKPAVSVVEGFDIHYRRLSFGTRQTPFIFTKTYFIRADPASSP